jgi:hypothetical protein
LAGTPHRNTLLGPTSLGSPVESAVMFSKVNSVLLEAHRRGDAGGVEV